MKLSVIIITRNEAANIPDCLNSVRFADEIVVVDSESTDDTTSLCRAAGAIVITSPFQGYGQQKNLALDNAHGDWVLSLDADERVPNALRNEILETLASDHPADGYRVARQNYVGNVWIRHGGWFPDYTIRLFRRGRARFVERSVHEAVHVNGRVATLREPLQHLACRDFQEFAKRQERYAKLAAMEMARRGRRATRFDLWLRPLYTFIRSYVIRRGFLDGRNGWILACIYTRYTYSKYQHLRSAAHR